MADEDEGGGRKRLNKNDYAQKCRDDGNEYLYEKRMK